MPERAAAAAIDLLPAIDLLGGRVVRLQQGDFEQTTAFSEDPAAVAAGFIDAGASWIHVVDLDGARTGSPSHGTVIRAIIEAAGAAASIEVAGGLRSEQAVEHALTLGAARVVVGTRALADPDFAAELVRSFGPDRIAVALDVRHGSAVGQAWDPGAAGVPLDLALGRLLDSVIDRIPHQVAERSPQALDQTRVDLDSMIEDREADQLAAAAFGVAEDPAQRVEQRREGHESGRHHQALQVAVELVRGEQALQRRSRFRGRQRGQSGVQRLARHQDLSDRVEQPIHGGDRDPEGGRRGQLGSLDSRVRERVRTGSERAGADSSQNLELPLRGFLVRRARLSGQGEQSPEDVEDSEQASAGGRIPANLALTDAFQQVLGPVCQVSEGGVTQGGANAFERMEATEHLVQKFALIGLLVELEGEGLHAIQALQRLGEEDL